MCRFAPLIERPKNYSSGFGFAERCTNPRSPFHSDGYNSERCYL